ncbi:MAG: hypothetical protein EBZ49_00620 [Proteobacteria bacterium]|nr:hypothetical protein [Pseudomonadota bacterium]
MKERLKKKYGTLRVAAAKLGINYYRLCNITSGWIVPKPEEAKKIGITASEFRRVFSGRAA